MKKWSIFPFANSSTRSQVQMDVNVRRREFDADGQPRNVGGKHGKIKKHGDILMGIMGT
jgi:hypothetical protein